MPKIILYIFILFYITSCCKKQKKIPITKHQKYAYFMKTDSMHFDFGTIKENEGLIKHTFKIKNTSNDTVTINNVLQGCGCISVSYPQQPIFPDSTIGFTVSFNPKNKNGIFYKTIFISLNDGEFYITPKITGYIK